MRRAASRSLLLLAVLGAGLPPADAGAHAGLARSDPPPGATVASPPNAVRISASERLEPSLSEIRVRDERGIEYQTGRPQPIAGDPESLLIAVRPLPRGVHRVSWRVVSAVDGHPTSGSYAFGVRVAAPAAAISDSDPDTSRYEIVARWLLLSGLIVLLGAAAGVVARFGGTGLGLATAGWLAASAGLLLLADAQRRGAETSLGELLDTEVGRDLIWRGAALAVAGAALLVAWRARPRRRAALGVAGAATLGAIVVHTAAGHAAGSGWPDAVTVLSQASHFAAAGVWFGGLAALLIGVRGAPSEEKAVAVRRFSAVAAGALGVVVVTGTVRAIDELAAFDDLADTGYGRAVLAKVAILAGLAALGLRNRRRSVAAARTDLEPLRRTSRTELGLATVAVAVAALLGGLAPPVAGRAPSAPPALTFTKVDGGEAVRVRLTVASRDPGPNTFTVDVANNDAGDDVRVRRVRLAFTPLDDPGVETTTLTLDEDGEGSYSGSGANIAFDGRWRVTVFVDTFTGSAEVRFDLRTSEPDHFLAVFRPPGEPPIYTMQIAPVGSLRLSVIPPRAGRTTLDVYVLDVLEAETPTQRAVVTTATGRGATVRQPLRRLSKGHFAADVDLAPGRTAVTVVARLPDGTRLRGVFPVRLSG